jgi:YD repeat-containing protein
MIKLPIGCLLFCVITQACEAQYYYKDLVVNRENSARWQTYHDNHVKAVTLKSLESDGKPTEGFTGDQAVSADYLHITTHTKTSGTVDSWIIADYSPKGRLIKNTDTSDTYQNSSEYRYDEKGRIAAIIDTSLETDNHFLEVEQHLWSYDPAQPELPLSMLKIKNGNDTTVVHFIPDGKGNIAEEHAIRKGSALPTIFYYYDADNHLTDIVRYNERAKRLLPIELLEYGEGGRVSSALIVPEEGNSFYQKWYYEYDEKGLKVKDFCYNKEKELLGSVEYQYTFNP